MKSGEKSVPKSSVDQSGQTAPAGGSNPSGLQEKMKSMQGSEWGRVGLAVIVSVGTYYLMAGVLFGEMNFFLKHFLILAFAILLLAGINAAQKTPPIIGKAVTIFLVLIFLVNIARHYFISSDSSKEKDGNRSENVIAKDTRKQVVANEKFMILFPGTHTFEVGKDSTTCWLALPAKGKYHYEISSPTYSHLILLEDGHQYKDGPDVVIPWQERMIFKLCGLAKEKITVKVIQI